jgi:glutathione S-transferase
MSVSKLLLISHALCPYVQRAVIVLTEKNVPFERRDIDLSNKPQWFLDISPLGKTPVLLVNNSAVFESAVICEYLDETHPPRLHPEDALTRAQHRSWIEFGSQVLNGIAVLYNAADEAALLDKAAALRTKFVQLESALGEGPWFSGDHFSIVDAVFGPVFRYFDVIDEHINFGLFTNLPKLTAWRKALAARPSVRNAVSTDYAQRLEVFLIARKSALSSHILYTHSNI